MVLDRSVVHGLGLAGALLACAAVAARAQAQAPAPAPAPAAAPERPRFPMPQGPRVTSPEVAADGRVTFRILAPKAQSVRLMGDVPSEGPTVPMQPPAGRALAQGAEGVWEVAVPLAPGAYRYNFNVDGVSVIDPRNPSTSESNENTWSLVHVPGADFMDTKLVPHGAVAAVTYYSTALKRFRRMHVYTPAGYETSAERYPVFYLLHGAMDCDDSWWTVGRAGFILDNLIAAGKAKPMIVVMPAGHTGPFSFNPGAPRPPVDEFQASPWPTSADTPTSASSARASSASPAAARSQCRRAPPSRSSTPGRSTTPRSSRD
jgi:enterochelin esterase family protein